MTQIIGFGPTLNGVNDPDFKYTFNLAADIQALYLANYGAPGVKYGEAANLGPLGLAVTLDTTAANQVRLAHDGDPILGELVKVENRVSEGIWVGTVQTQGGLNFPILSGATVNVGDVLGGSTASPGYVQTIPSASVTALQAKNRVVEVVGDGTVTILI